MKSANPRILYMGLLVAALLFFDVFSPALAATSEKSGKPAGPLTDKIAKSESPIRIVADRMEARQQEKTVVFEGHVVVQQDDMTLTASKLTVVSLADDGKGDAPAAGNKDGRNKGDNQVAENKADSAALAEKIDYIEAEGGIKVTQQDKLATSDKAIFYQKDQKVVLYGHPVVNQGKDRVEGKLITIYLQDGRSVVEGGKDTPVQAVLFPGKKE